MSPGPVPLLSGAAERQFAGRALEVLLILLLAWWGGSLARRALERVERRRAGDSDASWSRRRTIYRLLVSAVRYVLGFVAVVMVLDLFGFRTGSLLAGAGVIGLALSFGAQGLVQDVVSGLTLMYEDPFAVGDQVVLAGSVAGIVEELGLRATILRGAQGERIYLPNRLILQVTNLSRLVPVGREVRLDFPAGADPDAVRSLLQGIADAAPLPVTVEGVVDLAPGRQVWGLWIGADGDTGKVERQLREAVLRAAAGAGIGLAGG